MIETTELGFLRIALPELSISLGNPRANRQLIEACLQEAHNNSCHWVHFPAMVMTGTSIGDLYFQEKVLNDAKEELIDLAKASQAWQCMANIGFPFAWKNRIYACQAVVGQGKIWSILPQSILSTESRAFSTWNTSEVLMISFGPWQVPLGNSLLEEEQTGLTIRVLQGQEGFLRSSLESGDSTASVYLWSDHQEATADRAFLTKAYLEQTSRILPSIWAYSSPGKGESSGDVVYDGLRLLSEFGSTLMQANLRTDDGFMVCDTHYRKVQILQRKADSVIKGKNEQINASKRVELPRFTHTALSGELHYPVVKNPWLPVSSEERQIYCSELFRLQVRGLARRLEHTGSAYAILGVSGGLDSTLALLVANEAMRSLGKTSASVLAVTMPGFGTSGRTYANALSLMKSLQVTQKEISIVAACEQHFKDIDHPLHQHDVTFENAQARERTQILMDIANQVNGLVVGTGDLSEIALGWCTYNGDQMSMYNPNHSLTKTMIREVVAWIAKTSSNSILRQTLEDVIQTPVSPELLPSQGNEFHQKTEEALGPYEIHDFYLYHMAVCGLAPKDIFFLVQRAFPEYTSTQLLQWLRTFYRRFLTQQFKRSPSADGARVTGFSLSPRGDWQMPSDLQIQNWLQELEF